MQDGSGYVSGLSNYVSFNSVMTMSLEICLYISRYLNSVHLKIVIGNQEHVFNFSKSILAFHMVKALERDDRLVHNWIKIWMKSLFNKYLPITFSQLFFVFVGLK